MAFLLRQKALAQTGLEATTELHYYFQCLISVI